MYDTYVVNFLQDSESWIRVVAGGIPSVKQGEARMPLDLKLMHVDAVMLSPGSLGVDPTREAVWRKTSTGMSP